MAIYPDSSQLSDFLLDTLPVYIKRKWQDLSQTRQETVYSSRVVPKFGVSGGTKLVWNVQTSHQNSFTDRGMGHVETAQPENMMDQAEIPWASSSVGRAWNEELFDFNSGEAQIVDEMTTSIHGMWEDLINGEETRLWTAPTSSTENPRRPYGIPLWLQKASTNAAFGFNGGDPSGFTSLAGIPTTVAGWKNGNFGYAAVSQSDCLPKLSEAIAKSYFKPPRAYPAIDDSKPQYVIYSTYPFVEAMQNLQTASNDNLGTDVGKYRGTVMYRGIPISWVPCLTNSGDAAVDTQHPIYGIDWSKLKCFYKTGWDWAEQPLQTPPDQPTVRKLWLICWRNYRMIDRRSCFVGHTTTFAQ